MRRISFVLAFLLMASTAGATVLINESFESGYGVFTPLYDESSVISDSSAPDGSKSLQIRFPSGFPNGNAPGGAETYFTNSREIYGRFYFKLSAGFSLPSNNLKCVFIWGANNSHNNVIGVGDWGNRSLYYAWQGDGTRISGSGTYSLGVWNKVDFYMKMNSAPGATDGILKIWLNDDISINLSNRPFTPSGYALDYWNDWSFTPIYGGNDVPQTQYMYLDEAQLQTTPFGTTEPPPPGTDTNPPAVYNRNPDSGATNIPATNRVVEAHIYDDSGVDITKIKMSVGKNGGAKTAYTCASGLTCTGSSTDYLISRTMASDWTPGDTVQVLIDAADLASPPNTMPQVSYSYFIAASSGGPYPQSSLISRVDWQFSTAITTASGSDQWPMTWAGDNNVYALWDDGGGFGGDDTKCRTQYGMAKITNDPPSTLSTTNVLGCKSDGTGCVGTFTHDAACNASFASTILGYGEDIVALDNILYSIVTVGGSTRTARIAHSTNFGQTWTSNSWSWSQNAGDWRPDGFLQRGIGYDTRDYLYVVGAKVGDANHTYLARYPLTIHGGTVELDNVSQFQWFNGTTAYPSWGSWGSAVPVHTDSAGGNGGHMTYFPGLGRYIFTQTHGTVQQFAMYDSPNPWGPWTTIMYSDNWGGYGTSLGLWYSIVPKWISADGKSFWMSFSGGTDGTVAMDDLHLIKGTFVVAGTPSPPTGVTVGSNFYGPYFYGAYLY